MSERPIFDVNFIITRHAMTCANILQKGLSRDQLTISKYTSDTDITKIGIQQCLQLSDFLNVNKERGIDYITGNSIGLDNAISGNLNEKPITLFCCSELRRTNETLYVSYIRYMNDYIKQGHKILVLPWLNEKVFLIGKKNTGLDEDNIPETLEQRQYSWKKFIERLDFLFRSSEFNRDLGRGDVKSFGYEKGNGLDYNWKRLFHLSEFIYNWDGKIIERDPFHKDSKNPMCNFKIGLVEENMKAMIEWIYPTLLGYFNEIGMKIENKLYKINLVMVCHHYSGEVFIDKLLGNEYAEKIGLSHTANKKIRTFQKQQLVNCELVKLPAYRITPRDFNPLKEELKESGYYRLFPVGFYNKILKISIPIKKENDIIHIYRYYIFYAYRFNLFFSLFEILSQKILAIPEKNRMPNYFDKNSIDFIEFRRYENQKPLIKFLNTPYIEYLKEFDNIILTLKKLKKYYEGSKNNFYNYDKLHKIALFYKKLLKSYTNNLINNIENNDFYINNINNETHQLIFKTNKLLQTRKNITIGEVFGLKELHKYFFDGCDDKLKYLCGKCPNNEFIKNPFFV